MPPKCRYLVNLINAFMAIFFGTPDLHSMVTVAITYSHMTVDTATVHSPREGRGGMEGGGRRRRGAMEQWMEGERWREGDQ